MKVALAFSGGLDTSWCIPILQSAGHEVVTVTVNVGGLGPEELQEISVRSAELGATNHLVVEATEQFYQCMVRFLIYGNVLRGSTYPLSVGAERALQAQETARVAKQIGAGAVAHGCTAAGNDQFRFDTTLRCVAPGLQIIAPVRDQAPSRAEQHALLAGKGIQFPEQKAAYSVNSGLWGLTIGGTETTGTTQSIPEQAWHRTRDAFESQQVPSQHSIEFLHGDPVALDGEQLTSVQLILKLDQLAGRYGIGRGIHLGETILGIKGRVAFEAPAATVIISAHRELEKLTLTKRQQSIKDMVAAQYGEWVHEGLATDPAGRNAEALLVDSQKHVTGAVHFELRTGNLFITGVESRYSLHAASRAVYGEAVGEWTPEEAKGFGRLHGLSGVLFARTEAST